MTRDEPTIGDAPEVVAGGDRKHRLLRAALRMFLLFAAGALAYSLQSESALFRAVALQLALSAIVTWAAIDARRIRKSYEAPDSDGARDSELREARALHHLYVAGGVVAVLATAGVSLLSQYVAIVRPHSPQQVVGGAIAAMLSASLWTILVRALSVDSQSEDRELASVRLVLSEARLIGLLAALVLLGSTVVPAIEVWFSRILLLWVLLTGGELLLRVLAGWFREDTEFVAPIHSIIRQICFSSTNPVAALFDVAEQQFGLSIRSTWTIRFLRRSVAPIVLGCVVIVWLSTCFVVIEPNQAGARETFGRAERSRLDPGLHGKLPWPFAVIHRFPVRVVQTMQIGFAEDSATEPVTSDQQRVLLWTKPHAEEFALVLGSESEVVAVNAIVYFTIADETDRFLDFVYQHVNPAENLEAYAYRVLMEETRSATLDHVLSTSREQFAQTVERRLQELSDENRLGLDVVDVALVNIHPPVDVAADYLNVINAGIDANRSVIEAEGEAAGQLQNSERQQGLTVAEATVSAMQRVSEAGRESAEFEAVNEGFSAAPETYRLRLWYEAWEASLANRRLFLIDADLPNVVFGDRPLESSRSLWTEPELPLQGVDP